jgi:hypothetical protein
MYNSGTPLYRVWLWLFAKLYGSAFPQAEIERRAHRSAGELTYCVMISSGLATTVVLWVKHGSVELFSLLLYVFPLAILGAPVLLVLWRILLFAVKG